MTSDLARRLSEHRAGDVPGFTARYGVRTLVHVEAYGDIRDAIERERRLKKWRRSWKLALIEATNPSWADLGANLGASGGRADAGSPPSRG